jgi:hypothetical protein
MWEKLKEEYPLSKRAGFKIVYHVPLVAFAVVIDSTRNFFTAIPGEIKIYKKKLPIIQPFRCETCKRFAQICPECGHVWRLEQFPEGYSTVVCPICIKELAYL